MKNSIRKLNIGIANLLNGTFVSFNDNFKTRDLIKVLKASVSYPGVFQPF
jgi:predicted acylesterase/phospholipase RssA